MRALIVDDEYETLEEIKDIVNGFNGFEVVGAYTNPLKALSEIGDLNADCAFLDIEMPGMSGIDLAEKLQAQNSRIETIFITAFNHYATQAFDVNAIDYILKPINPKRFKKSAERLLTKLEKSSIPAVSNIVVRSLGSFEVLLDGNLIVWGRSKAKELLAYLLHYEGKQRNKYKICEELWPECEPKKALINLQTTIYSLRKSLGASVKENLKIQYSNESYTLKIENIFWDVVEFEKLYYDFLKNGDTNLAQKAIRLYQGEYMGSEDWSWSQLLVENIAIKYDKLLEMLANSYYKKGLFMETKEIIIKLLERQVPENHMILMLLDSVYQKQGINGLSQQLQTLQTIYLNNYDLEVEPEILDYCNKKGVIT